MKKFLKVLGWSLVVIAGLAVVAYAVAWGIAKSRYEKESGARHDAGFPIPFPLDDAELTALREERMPPARTLPTRWPVSTSKLSPSSVR